MVLTKLIPPKIQSWSKFLAWKLCSKSHIFLKTSWIPATEGSKFKLDCVESKNGYILLISVINFKSRFINFVYIFLRYPVVDFIIYLLTCKPVDVTNFAVFTKVSAIGHILADQFWCLFTYLRMLISPEQGKTLRKVKFIVEKSDTYGARKCFSFRSWIYRTGGTKMFILT